MKKYIYLMILGITFVVLGIGLAFFLKAKPNQENKVEEKDEINIDMKLYSENRDNILQQTDNADNFLSEMYPIKDIDKLKEEDKTKFLLDTLFATNNTLEQISIDQLNQEKLKYFNDFTIYSQSIKYENSELYSFSDNIFKRGYSLNQACKVTSIFNYEKVTKKQWTVNKKVYYIKLGLKSMDNLEYIIEVYKTKEDCLAGENQLLTKNQNTISLTEEEISKIDKQLQKLNYTFINKNNIYKLKSITNE